MEFTRDEVASVLRTLTEHIDKLKRVEGAPQDDLERYEALVKKFTAYRGEHFKENWLDELLHVGLQKPMGYFHASEVKDHGYSFEDIEKVAKQRGLKTKKFRTGFSGETIYFYDEDALTRFLKGNEKILVEAKWPVDPGLFIDKVSQESVEPDTKLFDIIAGAFGDEKNRRLS